MKRILRKSLMSLGLLLFVAVPVLSFSTISHADSLLDGSQSDACQGVTLGGGGCPSDAQNSSTINNIIKAVVDLLSAIIGIVSVFVIIIQGFRFITSGGDTNTINNARNAILYAVVGIVIAAVAQLIVHYVIGASK